MFKDIRSLLDQLNHSPNKKLGQNFLVDGNILRKSIAMADVQAEDAIVEIGPGLGTLTRALLETSANGASRLTRSRDPHTIIASHPRRRPRVGPTRRSAQRNAHLQKVD